MDNLILDVQFTNVLTRCSGHPQALFFDLRMTSRNVGKLYTKHYVVHKESSLFLYTAAATEKDVTLIIVLILQI